MYESIDTKLSRLGVDPSRLNYQRGVIPVFADKTNLVLDRFKTWESGYRAKFGLRQVKDPEQNAIQEVQTLAKVGALAFGMRRALGERVQRSYEVACGLGVSALAYALLGEEDITAIDLDAGGLIEANLLAGELGVNINFQRRDAGHVLYSIVNKSDFVFARNPEPQLRHTFLRMLGTKLNHALLCELFDPEEDKRLGNGLNGSLSKVSFKGSLVGYGFKR
jgi:hypothetical protein